MNICAGLCVFNQHNIHLVTGDIAIKTDC